ncbi:MAG: hypothetical protein JWN95_673 [Frankiales bacterium]|nr:hypothetical protein [Frankiales bacterium]
MRIIVAADLDRTLIYSRAALALAPEVVPDLACVERYEGSDSSFMTMTAARLLVWLAQVAEVVPVTTRIPAQLQRVTLPSGSPRFAIAANGGVLLVDGVIDQDWQRTVTGVLRLAAPLPEIWLHLQAVCEPDWTLKLRNAEDMFCYAVVRRADVPEDFLVEITAWAAARGWSTSLQGSKLYVVPRPLTKSAAVGEVARRVGADVVLAAGDSLLDIDLLELADRGIHPAHGEITESGWTCAGVESTGSVGAQAGEDICRWFAEQVKELGAA